MNADMNAGSPMQQEAQQETEGDAPLTNSDEQLLESLQKDLADAQAKAEENWDRLLRANAEIENMRRRARVDIENSSKFATERFSRELLGVVDSLEQALATNTDANSAAKENFAAVREGLDLTYKLLLDTLEKFGIKMLNPIGEAFNPAQHEALAMQATDTAAANSVLLVAQKGFTIHERVLRPARVIVAKPLEG